MLEVGFVIRSKNEEQHIGYALQSIFDHFGNETPVVVVDNESSDDTLSVVGMFPAKYHDITVITVDRAEYSPGLALNAGINELRRVEDIWAFGILSAHCQLTAIDHDVLQDALLHHAAVFGKQVPIYRGKRITGRYVWENFGDKRAIDPIEKTSDSRPFFHNAFSFITREAWEHTPFDRDLAGKEDRYWAAALQSRGEHVCYEPELVCNHFWTPNGATWRGMG